MYKTRFKNKDVRERTNIIADEQTHCQTTNADIAVSCDTSGLADG
jgi:hypothetical protein